MLQTKAKKLMFLLVMLSIFCWLNQAQASWAADDYVFRKVKWGMSSEEIVASEAGQSDAKLTWNEDGLMVYEIQIFGAKANVKYSAINADKGLQEIFIRVPVPALGAYDVEGTLEAFRQLFTEQYGLFKVANYSRSYLQQW